MVAELQEVPHADGALRALTALTAVVVCAIAIALERGAEADAVGLILIKFSMIY